ncbi:MAG: hypothetical protein U9Q73_01315 [Nanoarchaeota archaeon]|nr:hypothetical protein [Nanoarchaeota archaeon]
MNKTGLIGMMIIAGILLVVGFFWFVGERGFGEEEENEIGGECVKVRTTCCHCNMGGVEKCVLESEVEEYEANLSECSKNPVCTALYACQIESCEYFDGECVAR